MKAQNASNGRERKAMMTRDIEVMPAARIKGTSRFAPPRLHIRGFGLLLLVLIVELSARAIASDANDRAGLSRSPGNQLVTELRKFARAQAWADAIPTKGDTACPDLLNSILHGQNMHAVEPIAKGQAEVKARLPQLASCPAIREAELVNDLPESPIAFWNLNDFGDRNFMLFAVEVSDPTTPRPITFSIIYGEYLDQKLLLNAYFDSYSAVDMKSCKKLGGDSVQRPLPGDEKAGALRDLIHGLFRIQNETWFLKASAQMGREGDPQSYKKIEARRIDSTGQFALKCVWMPTTLQRLKK